MGNRLRLLNLHANLHKPWVFHQPIGDALGQRFDQINMPVCRQSRGQFAYILIANDIDNRFRCCAFLPHAGINGQPNRLLVFSLMRVNADACFNGQPIDENMAQALAPQHIRVNAIAPGPTLPNPRQAQAEFDKQARLVPLGHGAGGENVNCGGNNIIGGRALAEALAADGWAIAAHYAGSKSEAEELVDSIQDKGGKAIALQADLRDAAAVEKLIPDAVAALGPLTALINNASMFERDSAHTLSQESWDTHLNANERRTGQLVIDENLARHGSVFIKLTDKGFKNFRLGLVALLAERQKLIAAAGGVKPSRDTVRDEARIEEVIRLVLQEAERAGLARDIAEPVWRQLIESSIAYEYGVFDKR